MIAVCQYIELLISLFVLGWLLSNFWKILIKQEKYKVLPLVTFYALAIPLLIIRIYIAIYFFVYITDHQMLPFLLPCTLAFLMAIDLCWIITELSLRIRYSLKTGNSFHERRLKRNDSPALFIKRGRIVVTLVIGMLAFALAAAMIVIG